jgi:hypothetical protein
VFVIVLLLPNFSSAQLRPPPTLEEMTRPQANRVERTAPLEGAEFVATTTQRIDRDHMEIRVFQGGKPVELSRDFHELVTATPADHHKALDGLAGKTVAVIPSEKRYNAAGAAGVSENLLPWRIQADHWDIFTGVGGVGEQTLADNIFKVRQALLCSRKNPIEIHLNGQVYHLKPGQVLLVL